MQTSRKKDRQAQSSAVHGEAVIVLIWSFSSFCLLRRQIDRSATAAVLVVMLVWPVNRYGCWCCLIDSTRSGRPAQCTAKTSVWSWRCVACCSSLSQLSLKFLRCWSLEEKKSSRIRFGLRVDFNQCFA